MKALEKMGYIWRPKFGRSDRHLVFAKGNHIARTHYLHMMKYKGKLGTVRYSLGTICRRIERTQRGTSSSRYKA